MFMTLSSAEAVMPEDRLSLACYHAMDTRTLHSLAFCLFRSTQLDVRSRRYPEYNLRLAYPLAGSPLIPTITTFRALNFVLAILNVVMHASHSFSLIAAEPT